MTEPVKCRCGEKAIIESYRKVYWVSCFNYAVDTSCWSGPNRVTKRKAINAWNKVMEVK